jgi:hypothetical protein
MTLLLLFHLWFIKPSLAEDKLPADMNALIVRLKACDELWKDDFKPSKRPVPGEAEALEKIARGLKKRHCATLIKELHQIRTKYHDKPEVTGVCDRVLGAPRFEKYKNKEGDDE